MFRVFSFHSSKAESTALIWRDAQTWQRYLARRCNEGIWILGIRIQTQIERGSEAPVQHQGLASDVRTRSRLCAQGFRWKMLKKPPGRKDVRQSRHFDQPITRWVHLVLQQSRIFEALVRMDIQLCRNNRGTDFVQHTKQTYWSSYQSRTLYILEPAASVASTTHPLFFVRGMVESDDFFAFGIWE